MPQLYSNGSHISCSINWCLEIITEVKKHITNQHRSFYYREKMSTSQGCKSSVAGTVLHYCAATNNHALTSIKNQSLAKENFEQRRKIK